jgi:hypothetical protein
MNFINREPDNTKKIKYMKNILNKDFELIRKKVEASKINELIS